MNINLTGKYSKDRIIIKEMMMRFGNLSISALKRLNTGSRTMSHSISITPEVLSFGCHLGGCNLPGDGLQIPHSKIKDCDMNITSKEKKENPTISLIDELFMRIYILRDSNSDEIKRFREFGIECITKLKSELKSIAE